MKNLLILISLLIAFSTISCEKNEPGFNFDCIESYVSYNENSEYSHQEIYYYKNSFIVKVDCSPRYIWSYKYDNSDNLIEFESENGSYFLYEYDSENRCIKSEQYIADTLYVKTHKFYSDTLLVREINVYKNGDTLSNVDYYYNNDNKIDSVISNKSKTYHYYSFNNYKILKFDDSGIKYFESNATYEYGQTIKYEEFYYNEYGDLSKSFIEAKNYDNDKNLVEIVIEQFDLSSNHNHYDDIRHSYDSMRKKVKSESYDSNGNRIKYIDYIYNGEKLVKKQSFDSDGTKTGYTIVENNCNR